MKREYQSDIKRRVAAAVNTGVSAQTVAARLHIPLAEVRAWASQYEVDPKKLTRWQRKENESISRLLQQSTHTRYPSDFRGRVAAVVRSGVSAQVVAARLGLAMEAVQKWAGEYAIEKKKLTSAQAEKELASLQTEVGSMERQAHQRLMQALADPTGLADSPSLSSGAPVILLLGYWPPTDCGHMLSEFAGGEFYKGYNVISISTYFGDYPWGWEYLGSGAPPSWNPPPYGQIPHWGRGDYNTHPMVDYQDTARFFWNIVQYYNPIAIMSFSRVSYLNYNDTSSPRYLRNHNWYIERYAYNYANADWFTGPLSYWPNDGDPAISYPPPRWFGRVSGSLQSWTLDSPYIGGGQDDPSPYGPGQQNPKDPVIDGQPNPNQAAGAAYESSLPRQDIIDAINNLSGLKAPIQAGEGNQDELGKFVSAYMAYLVHWYGNDAGVWPPGGAIPIQYYGHTHVGQDIDPADATIALKTQLDLLIDHYLGSRL